MGVVKGYDVFIDWAADLLAVKIVPRLEIGSDERTVSVPEPSEFVVANVMVKLSSKFFEFLLGTYTPGLR